MEYSSYPHILSDREQKEWIPACPVQVKRVTLSVPEKESGIVLHTVIAPCGGFAVDSVMVSLKLTDARHKEIAVMDGIVLRTGECTYEGEIPEGAVYAYVTVTEVKGADGTLWRNPDGGKGIVLPEQRIIWQTDPLYEGIRYVTEGVVKAKYYPDEPMDGAWRCACGQVNLVGTGAVCGACGCEKAWLDEQFDETKLASAGKEAAEKKSSAVKKKTKKQRNGVSDKAKFILILAAAALVIGCIAVSPMIAKSIRYAKAEGYLAAGEYDLAIEAFTKLEGFSDSETKLQEANYQKAKAMTGLDEVNMVSSSRMKCYSITEDGVLSFRKDDYKGDMTRFVVPDVVDGIVVRALDENFFMNCKTMEEVTISDCVEVLGDGTFFNCEALTKVNFGKNVREMGARCFRNCLSLRELTIPDTVEKIGLRTFNGCARLTSVTLGSGITKIPDYLFSDCMSLETVTVTGALTEVGESAFVSCPSFSEFVFHGTEEMFAGLTVEADNEVFLGAKITIKD